MKKYQRNTRLSLRIIHSIRSVTNCEFFIFIGNVIFTGAVGKAGKYLFEKECNKQKECVFCMSPTIDLTPCMAMRHFEDIKTYFPYAFADLEKKKLYSSQS
jgi:hypothetical protein